MHPLAVNLFPLKIKQLPGAGRVKHFVKNWQKLTNDPMILDVVSGYKIHFTLPQRQSKLPNSNHLTKKATDLVDPGNVEEGCYSSFRSQRGSISQLAVSCERDLKDLKDLNNSIPYELLQGYQRS